MHEAFLRTLLSVAILSVAGGALPFGGGLAANEVDRDAEEISQLVEQLGHDDWNVREDAQSRLRELNERALPALRRVLQSESPEVVERAQYLLDVLDPVGVTFRITRVNLPAPGAGNGATPDGGALGSWPEISEVLESTTTGVNEVQLSTSLSSQSATKKKTLEYRLRFHVTSGGLALNADLVPNSGQSWPLLNTFLDGSGPVTLIDYGDEAVYLQIGSHIERRSRHYVSVLEWKVARRSEQSALDSAGARTGELAFRRDSDLESLTQHLRDQLQHADLDARLDAIKILGLIRDTQAADLLQPLLEDSRTHFVALLALGRIGNDQALDSLRGYVDASLEDSAEEPRFPGDESVTRDSFALTEAAMALLDHGDAAALRLLTSKLGKLDHTEFHQVLTTLTGYLERDRDEIEEHDRDLLRALMRTDVVSSFVWRDAEVLYLYLRAADLIPRDEEDLGRVFLRDMGRTVLEERGAQSVAELKSFLSLWSRLARRFELRDVLFEFATDLVTGTRDIHLLGMLASSLADTSRGGTLKNEEFDAVREIILAQVQGSDSQTINSLIRLLVRFSQQAVLSDSRRPAMVGLLWECARLKSSMRGDLLREILRRTGITLGENAEKARPRAQKRLLTIERLREPVESWLELPTLPERDHEGKQAGNKKVELVEFDVVFEPGGGSWFGSGDGKTGVDVLDGRILEVTENVAFQYTDRWGNHVSSRLDPQRSGPSTKEQRYRLAGEQTLVANVPLLRSPRQRSMSVHHFRYSSSSMANYRIPLPRHIQLQSVILVHSPDTTTEELRYVFDRTASPAENWKRFKQHFVKNLEHFDTRQMSRNLRIVETLRLRNALPFLRERFRATPSFHLASVLLRMGDETSLPYMREQLTAKSGQVNPRFAQILTEHGDRQGFSALLSFLESNTNGNHVYQSVTALDQFLQMRSPSDSERVQVLDLLFKKLKDGRYQSRSFIILRREIGTDFGYSDTWRAASGQARKEAQSAVVSEAMSWWDSQDRDASTEGAPQNLQGNTPGIKDNAPTRDESKQPPRDPRRPTEESAKRDG